MSLVELLVSYLVCSWHKIRNIKLIESGLYNVNVAIVILNPFDISLGCFFRTGTTVRSAVIVDG